MHARGRGHRARLLGRDGGGPVAQIDHDNLVADAVHLGKRMIGERAHGIFPTGACLIWRTRADWPVRQICVCSLLAAEAHEFSVMGLKHASRVRIAKSSASTGTREPGRDRRIRPWRIKNESPP